MAKAKNFGSTKRFGARYGRTVKEKAAKVESVLRKKHKCPYCNTLGVKRQAAGIWLCTKCGAKFTGQAYTPEQRMSARSKQSMLDEELIDIEEPVKEEGEVQ
ncbi:50S ribosomal protein L37ae [Candidatus Woesearchaeota archaeon]|nr:50S ribosomal protein L37ae [Candidatus Woesearchaeota archaeon]